MCQVATPRVDAMVNVTDCRIVDAAAGALIVRESGGVVRFAMTAPTCRSSWISGPRCVRRARRRYADRLLECLALTLTS